MTEHKLTPEQIADVKIEIAYWQQCLDGGHPIDDAPSDIARAALSIWSHVAALDAELAAARAENARLRKVAEAAQVCAESREFTGREDPHHYRVPNEKLNAVINALAILHNPELDTTQEAE